MTTELYIVTGTSGTGKSTITPILKQALPSDYRVYDWDEIVRPYDGTDDLWAGEITQAMFKLTEENKKQDISTVVLGLIKPEWIRKYQMKHDISHIKFCLLDINRDERAMRLRERGAPEHLIHDLEELEGLPNWIKESGYDSQTIDTSNLTIQEVASQITQWVQ